MRNHIVAFLVLLSGCATAAGFPDQPDAAEHHSTPPGHPDAHAFTPADAAPPRADARTAPPHADAWTPPPIDAAMSTPTADAGGIFCTDDSECGTGECCFHLGPPPGPAWCAHGTTIPGIGCFPM